MGKGTEIGMKRVDGNVKVSAKARMGIGVRVR